MPTQHLEDLASDRETWSDLCHSGLKYLLSDLIQSKENRQERRHLAAAAVPHGPAYAAVFASDYGLHRHLRTHSRTGGSTVSSSKSTDN